MEKEKREWPFGAQDNCLENVDEDKAAQFDWAAFFLMHL